MDPITGRKAIEGVTRLQTLQNTAGIRFVSGETTHESGK